MKFVDETEIYVQSGDGGDGKVSFRRERNLAYGGPDGGPGGNGGSVILRASENSDTLLHLVRYPKHIAQNGEIGRNTQHAGKTSEDVIVEVPVGTIVYEKNEVVADLTKHGQEFVAVQGGRGGRGNKSFASAENQTPKEFTYGAPGEAKKLRLELKLIADVGLVGFPNAGKSTLLSRFSAARPKIADYPFTTIQPQLGIVSSGHGHELVMADIPGLIEGASEGAGMGVEFLRHVERCRFLLHLVDLCPLDGSSAAENVKIIRQELENFSPKLASLPQLLVGTKMDLSGSAESLDALREELGAMVTGISAVTGEGLERLRQLLFTELARHPRG